MHSTDKREMYLAVMKPMLSSLGKVVNSSNMSSEDKLKAIQMITEACKDIAVAHVHMAY